jgi:hypothetical protein
MLQFTENRQRNIGLSASSNPRTVLNSVGLLEASQTEAVAGTVQNRYISPLRLDQVLDALGIGGAGDTVANAIAKYTDANGTLDDSGVTISAANTVTVPKNNTTWALVLTHPDATDAGWDSTPIAAIYIARPPTATTRNLVDGIFLEADGATQDKGRGIHVLNYGKSDSIYVENRGEDSSGAAILLKTTALNATGAVIGTTEATQIGVAIRQETLQTPTASCASLLQLTANGAATEMLRIGSSIASQTGIIFRMSGASSSPVIVRNTADTATVFQVNNSGAIQVGAAGSVVGSVLFANATSGTITLQPVTGALGTVTLSLPAATDTLVGKATTDTLTNKTLTSPDINGGTADSLTSLSIRSTGAAFDLTFATAEVFTQGRTLTFATGDAARTITLSGSPTLGGQDYRSSGSVSFANIVISSSGAGPTDFKSTASGVVQYTWRSIPATGAAGDIMDWAFNWKDAAGNEYQGMLFRLSQDDATNGSEDTSGGFYTVTSGAALAIQLYMGNGVSIGTTTTAGGQGNILATGSPTVLSGTAIPAGGTAGAGYKFSSTSNFGVFFGSGAPTLSAAKGSLYLRSDGSGTSTRAYINTDGSTTWTAITTAA